MSAIPWAVWGRFDTEVVHGGWRTTCRHCSRTKTLHTVRALTAHQRHHTCSPEHVSATTRARAISILATLPRDPAHEVAQRCEDAVREANAWIPPARRGAA